MTAIILAGGKSKRMGHNDKAFLKIGKAPMIKQQLKLLKNNFRRIIIVADAARRYKGLKGVKVVPDIVVNHGPLAGILSGLLSSADKYNFVVACDMPFINPALIRYMYKKRIGYDVVVPRINNRYEPLFCVYSKSCVRHIRPLLDKKIFKVSRLFSKVKVKQISRKEVLRFGDPGRIFMNINTPDDLRRLNG